MEVRPVHRVAFVVILLLCIAYFAPISHLRKKYLFYAPGLPSNAPYLLRMVYRPYFMIDYHIRDAFRKIGVQEKLDPREDPFN